MVIGVSVTEELTVSAATPAVDLKSTEVNFNYNAEQIQTLPLQRSYSGSSSSFRASPRTTASRPTAAAVVRTTNT